MADKALNLLGIAQKGGNIVIGEDPVGNEAHSGHARLIILASDAANHTVRRAESYAALHDTPVAVIGADKAALGAVFGRTSVAMAALTDIKLAQRFLSLQPEPEKYEEQLKRVQEKADRMTRRKSAGRHKSGNE